MVALYQHHLCSASSPLVVVFLVGGGVSVSECAQLLHKGGARLVLCGTSWDKLESLFDSLTNDADPKEVRTTMFKTQNIML